MTPLRDAEDGLRAAYADCRALSGIMIGGALTFFRGAEGWGWLTGVSFPGVTIAHISGRDLTPPPVSQTLFPIFYVADGQGLFAATAIPDRIAGRHEEGA